MSTSLKAIPGRKETYMTQFSGGKFGVCLQLTRQRPGLIDFDTINFTKAEALATAAALIEFATDTREHA